MKNHIIALNGHMGSGKDTLGKHIVDDYGFHAIAIATPMYDFMEIFREILQENAVAENKSRAKALLTGMFAPYGYPPRKIAAIYAAMLDLAKDSNLLDDNVVKPRVFLQAVGALLRSYEADVYTVYLAERMKNMISRGQTDLVITDLRTSREIVCLKKIFRRNREIALHFVHIIVSFDNIVKRIAERDGADEIYVRGRLSDVTEEEIARSRFDFVLDGNRPFSDVVGQMDGVMKRIC